MRFWKRFRPIGVVLIVGCAQLIIPYLSRKTILWISRCVGRLAFRFSKRYRNRTLANLDLVFEDDFSTEEKRQIAVSSFSTFALVALDILWFSRKSDQRIKKWVFFDASCDSYFTKRPMITVAAHFGNWEVLGMAVAQAGYPAAIVAADLKNPFIEQVVNRTRHANWQRVIPKKGAVWALLKVLRSGRRIAVLIDQNLMPSEGGVFVDFFNRPVPVSRVVDALANKTGAYVLPVYCVPQPDGKYKAFAGPLIEPSEDSNKPNKRTHLCMASLESEIRKAPGYWNWMYKRWKYMPPGESKGNYPYYARYLNDG